MPIVQAIQLSSDSKVTGKFDLDSESYATQTIKEDWRIVSDTVSKNAIDIYNEWLATGGSDIGDYYAANAGEDEPGASAVCSAISFKRTGSDRQKDGPFVWNVSVEFSKPEDQTDSDETEISVSAELNDETDGRYDINDAPNVNSAYDFFEDKLPLKNKIIVFRYQKNYTDNPLNPHRGTPSIMIGLNCINSTAWPAGDPYALDPETCLLRSVSVSRKRHPKAGYFYWPTTIEIAYNPNGWKYKKADCGFYTRDGARILNEEGAPVEKAQLLDGAGNVLPRDSSTAEFCEFDLYGTFDLNALNLPSPFAENGEILALDNTPNNAAQGE